MHLLINTKIRMQLETAQPGFALPSNTMRARQRTCCKSTPSPGLFRPTLTVQVHECCRDVMAQQHDVLARQVLDALAMQNAPVQRLAQGALHNTSQQGAFSRRGHHHFPALCCPVPLASHFFVVVELQ
jgi:hypothetical protein